MTIDMWLVLLILVTAIVLFITEWLRVDVVALGVVVTLMFTGVLTSAEALSGFSNSAVLTIASLFIVGGAVLQTGLAGRIGRRVLAIAGQSEMSLIVVLMGAVALLSSFMSDTGTVAVLLPAIIMLTRSTNLSPAKLLIPLSFGALLGGAMTLIGTPPNIIVSDLLRQEGLEPFTFFSYTPVGFILVVAGIAFMVLIGRKLLPDRRAQQTTPEVASPTELIELYRLPDNLLRLRVRRGSGLVGITVGEANLRREYDINILKIMRPTDTRPAFTLTQARNNDDGHKHGRFRDTPIVPDKTTIFHLDDSLIVQGEAYQIGQAAVRWDLAVQPPKPKDHKALVSREVGIAEVVLPPRSQLIGKSLTESNFYALHHLTTLNIQRPNNHSHLDVNDTRLQFGDTLLVQGRWQDIVALRHHRRDFVVLGQPETMLAAPRQDKAWVALFILVALVISLIFDLMPVATLSMAAGLLMVLTGCLTMDEAYEAIDWKSIVLIAGMLPMSVALQKVGLVDATANLAVSGAADLNPRLVMIGLFLFTSLFTQVLSNTATTVIIAPIALATAIRLGVEPYAFLMAVAIAASMAFATPVASPTNTLVMGAGNYRFSDYMKVGIPLIGITMIITVLVVPLLFPF